MTQPQIRWTRVVYMNKYGMMIWTEIEQNYLEGHVGR